MTESSFVTVLIADSHEISRAGIVTLLRAANLNVVQAIDGSSGIKVIQEHAIDLVIFDNNMKPVSGFEIARYIQGAGLSIPVILVTDDQTSDNLHYAASLGIRHVLTKPIDPKRLESIIMQILARHKKNTKSEKISIVVDRSPLSPDQAMNHAISLARKNASAGFGGPYASVILDPNGYIIGEGVNLATSRFDPIAHAEVMAIRKATDFLQQPHLENCTIYSTSEPTKLAMALIESVGIRNIVFGLSHAETKRKKQEIGTAKQNIKQIGTDDVRILLKEFGHD